MSHGETHSQRLRREQFEQQVDLHQGYNFRVNLIEGSLFRAGLAMISVATVISAFLLKLGVSKALIGLVPGLFVFCWTAPQLLGAYQKGHLPEKRRTIAARRFLMGVPWILLAAVLAFYRGGAGWDRAAGLAVVLTVVAFACLGGYTVPLWVDLVGRMFRAESRGRFYGWRTALGAGCGLAVTVSLWWLLEPGFLAFPWGHAICFASAGAFFALGALFLNRSREPAAPEEQRLVRGFRFLAELSGELGGNRAYRFFLVTVVLGAFSGAGVGSAMATPFYITKAVEVLRIEDAPFRLSGATLSYVGLSTTCMVAGQVLSAMAGGRLVDRKGARPAYLLSILLSMGTPLLALFLGNQWAYLLVFSSVGATRGLTNVAYHNTMVEMVPPEARARAVGLANFLRSPFYLAAPAVGGVLVAWAGYGTLFAAAALVALVNAAVFLWGVGLRRPAGA